MSKTKDEKIITTYSELKTEVEKILKTSDNFCAYINTRKFELEVIKLASNTKFNGDLIGQVEKELQKAKGEHFDFTLFYILFTWKRRNKHQSLKAFYDAYEKNFSKYEILTHIKGMSILAEGNQANLKDAIKEIDEFIKNNSEISTHVGVLNLYVELVCSYCELKFDERDSDEVNNLLKQALDHIRNVIEQEEKDSKKAYQKFYLNKGRILVMLKQYEVGEQEINKAISLIPLSQDRAIIVNDYSQYLAKSSMIKAYDLNLKALDNYRNEKIKEINLYKVDSYKIITLVIAVIGFLLGSINIFTKIDEALTLLMLMLAYAGLMLLLVGIVLLCFRYFLKDYKPISKESQENGKQEKATLKIAIVLITVGTVIFAASIVIAILRLKNII